MSGKKKGKKGTKMNLTDFLGDNSVGSLVKPKPKAQDENEEEEVEIYPRVKKDINITALPTAPRAARGITIDMSTIPNEPPFTAFLGNIPFDATEQEIESFFAGMQITVRIPQGKAKGHAYADFEDRNALLEALQLDGNTLRNRPLNVAVAGQHGGRQENERRNEPRKDEYAESRAENTDNWRTARSSSGDRDFPDRSDDRDRGFGDKDRYGERDRYGDGGRRGYGSSYNRDFERSDGDDWGRGRKSEPRDEIPKERPKLNILPPSNKDNPTDSQQTQYSNRPSPFGDARPVDKPVPSQREDPVGSTERISSRPDPFGGARAVDINTSDARPIKSSPFGDARPVDKSSPFGDARPVDTKREEPIGASDNYNRPSPFGHSEPSPPEVKSAVEKDRTGRPKLNLLPRTKPAGSESNQPKASSIFGDAKPVDTKTKELAIDRKINLEPSFEKSMGDGIANKENQYHEYNMQPSKSPWGRTQKPAENKLAPKREKIEKPLPKSIDEMPKYEVPSEKIWAEKSKFDILMDEGDNDDDDD